ncbi:MaoC family dehydratase N-terminal domain-containing protein [Peribacillus asahii]|uniref:MaoC family dehydratase N-terminal domain-containing protein n=1 Tax=Peribacillus asahii TaxID=228899 RepID=UPI002079E330|nr:MaoC family dehydratase N-terminal domain-containing protein [Peribacillus asahii]USK61373.1 MaoC family dehydratase N-terminal domain-containing protein [Peribacillus asahii]USK71798.1 MaoC family dehydratase N-terminal domain-containing protein [Peribacillus asahii]
MFQSFIGARSDKVKNRVERGAVKKFAAAIGDLHPIYIDEETGRNSRYKQNIAPPTFSRVFDYGTIDGLNLPAKGLIHGEQTYTFKRPLLVEEEVYCYTEIMDYYEKSGKNGKMGFLVLHNTGEDRNGEFLFKAKQVVIITETVRKEISV